MKILVFDEILEGHHLEYLHHIYIGATDNPDNQYFFIVPKSFNQYKSNRIWPQAKNISVDFLDEGVEKKCKSKNLVVSALYKSYLLRKLCMKYGVDSLYLIKIMETLPFLFFFLPKNISIRSIIYQIYLYKEKEMGHIRLMLENLRYIMISKSSNVDKMFVLNDELSANQLNNRFSSYKFQYLPDPVPEVNFTKLKNIRADLGINNQCTVFLHFGSMEIRKGTLEILKSITLIKDYSNDKCFIFAGRVTADIREEFYKLLDIAKRKAHIILYDEFCSYDFLYDLCFSSDVILTPYLLTAASSGVIGYASLFKKPVIGPDCGLLGSLIKRYKMGVTLSNISPENLFRSYDLVDKEVTSLYCDSHQIGDFINTFTSGQINF